MDLYLKSSVHFSECKPLLMIHSLRNDFDLITIRIFNGCNHARSTTMWQEASLQFLKTRKYQILIKKKDWLNIYT